MKERERGEEGRNKKERKEVEGKEKKRGDEKGE